MLEIKIHNSGSSGNCVTFDDTIIIDAGWRCNAVGDVLLITHHHTDHVKHLNDYDGIPCYCLSETADVLARKHPFRPFNDFTLTLMDKQFIKVCSNSEADYFITAWEMKHDVPCVGYEITKNQIDGDEYTVFYATDFNRIVNEELFIRKLQEKDFDAIYIEGNNTLDPSAFAEVYFQEEGEAPPKDEFHRRRSFQNHCSIDYLISLFERAGYSKNNRFTEPVTLLHKSSFYYQHNVERIVALSELVNVTNPFL